MTPGATRVYLSLGSNLGDRLSHLACAAARLDHLPDVRVVAVSPVYETTPLGANGDVLEGQPAYLNCAVAADVSTGAASLRARTVQIERDLGRGEHGRWESRVIDIDLILFGDQQIGGPEVTVPHPRMMERAFVLRPIVDIDASITAPGIGRLADHLAAVSDQGCVLHASAAEFADAVTREGRA